MYTVIEYSPISLLSLDPYLASLLFALASVVAAIAAFLFDLFVICLKRRPLSCSSTIRFYFIISLKDATILWVLDLPSQTLIWKIQIRDCTFKLIILAQLIQCQALLNFIYSEWFSMNLTLELSPRVQGEHNTQVTWFGTVKIVFI